MGMITQDKVVLASRDSRRGGLGPPTDGDSGPGLSSKADPDTVTPGVRAR